MPWHPGSLQRRASEPRIPQGMDPDASRHQGAAVLRPAGHRSALQAGHRQEGSRRQEENVNERKQPLHSDPNY